MRELRTTTRPPGARAALVAVAVALFGLMSMHGWSSHVGAHPMGTAESSSVAITAATHDRAQSHPTTTGNALATVVASEPMTGHPAHGPDGDGLLGLCLAILTGLLFGIALLITRRNFSTPGSLLPIWMHSVFIGRDRDPPDLRKLCVIRC